MLGSRDKLSQAPRSPATDFLLCEISKTEENQKQCNEPSSELESHFDDFLQSVGKFGRYQQLVIFGILLPAIFAYSFAHGFWLFVIATPDKFWCHSSDSHSNQSRFMVKPSSDPGQLNEQQCLETIYSPWFNLTKSRTKDSSDELEELLIPCKEGWDFDRSVYSSTIVSEWSLVCDSDFLPTLVYIITTIVGTLGAPAGGYLSDHYGRKRTYFIFLTLEILAGIAVALSPSYAWFVVLASVHSISVYPTYQTIYTLGVEILSPGYRTTFSVLVGVFYALGSMASCGVAYAVRDWRMLVLACTLPLVGMLGFLPVMPESPRFNLTQRKLRQVEHFFRRVAKWNGSNFDLHCEEKLRKFFKNLSKMDAESQRRSSSFWDIFANPKLRHRACVLILLSATVAVCYGGLGFYAPKLGSNPFLNVFLTNMVDLPASLLTQLVADRIGRRLTLAINFFLGGIFCLASLFFSATEEHSYYPVLFFFLFARMFAVSSYTVEELVSCENFPTVLRGEGISLTNGVSGIVSNLGPLIVYLSVGAQWMPPMAWFGTISILGTFLVLFLPETVNKALPETIEDVEEFLVVRSFNELLAPARTKILNVELPVTEDFAKWDIP